MTRIAATQAVGLLLALPVTAVVFALVLAVDAAEAVRRMAGGVR